MIAIEKLGILLSPTNRTFENYGVFNPGVFQSGTDVHFLYRAVQNGNYSCIGYARSNGPKDIKERKEHPIILPEFDYEKKGIEDPRIVQLEDTFYITYTAYDGFNAMGALATSKDLIHFEKHGIITPQLNYQEYEELLLCNKHSLLPKYHHMYLLFKQMGLNTKKKTFSKRQRFGLISQKTQRQICFIASTLAWNSNCILRFFYGFKPIFFGRNTLKISPIILF